MGDEIKPEMIKKTQERLGKFIKKPVLTDKLLSKPPFRFLHDICTAAMRETGFFEGVLNATDCKADNIKDKDGKIAFLQKVIAAVESANGSKLTIKPGKVVAGHEPHHTNEFLQALAKALEKQVAENVNASATKPSSNQSKSKTTKAAKKPEKEQEPALKKKTSSTKTSRTEKPSDRGPDDGKGKATDKSPPRKSKISPRAVDQHVVDSGVRGDEDGKMTSKRRERSKLKVQAAPSSETLVEKPAKEEPPAEPSGPSEAERLESKRPVSAKPKHRKPPDETEETVAVQESTPMREVGAPEPQPSAQPKPQEQTSPPQSAQSPVNKTQIESTPKRPESSFLRMTKQSSVTGPVPPAFPTKEPDGVEDTSPTMRPLTGFRPTTGRPASARPAAPRIRDRGEISVREDVIKQSMGNVQIITEKKESEDVEEDENVVVVEPENDLIITDDLGRSPGGVDQTEERVDSGEHGLLVEQILETQKELDQSRQQIIDNKLKSKTEIEWKSSRNREATNREIAKLRLSIQTLTRSANPLGKLLDFLQEDVDTMQKELTNWREMNEDLDEKISRERSLTDQSIEPLKVQLKEIQQTIDQELEQMIVVKANILRNDQKIQKLLTQMK